MIIGYMDKTTLNTAIMFSDVVGSSKLYKELGDKEANAAISQCVSMMVGEVERHGGIVVKTIGDEVMARFETAAQACTAGIAIQQASLLDPHGLDIRVGAAYGTAILKDDDVFGEVVNDAAAIARVAKAQQILVSQPFADVLASAGEDFTVHPFDKIVMKGGQQATVIHRVNWEPQDITANATQVLDVVTLRDLQVAPHVELTYVHPESGVSRFAVTPKSTPFVVGRDAKICALGVPTDFASRDHFHIVYRRGKFLISDHSTNGTYVREDGEEVVYLRREEMLLRGAGVISMGQAPEKAAHLIRFQCAAAKTVGDVPGLRAE